MNTVTDRINKQGLIEKYENRKDGTLWIPRKDDGDHDFVNDRGVKFWFDLFTSRYLWEGDVTLPDVYCWFAMEPNGCLERVLIDHRTGDYLYASVSLEAVAIHIDMLKLNEKEKKR